MKISNNNNLTENLQSDNGQKSEQKKRPLQKTGRRLGPLPLQNLEERNVQDRPASQSLQRQRHHRILTTNAIHLTGRQRNPQTNT